MASTDHDELVGLIRRHRDWIISRDGSGADRIVCYEGDHDYGDAAEEHHDLDELVAAHLADVIEASEWLHRIRAESLREFAQWAQESDPTEHPFLGLDEMVQAVLSYAERIEASQ